MSDQPRQIGDEAVGLFERLRGNVRVVRGGKPFGHKNARKAGWREGFYAWVIFGRPKSGKELVTFEEFLCAYNLKYVMGEQFVSDALSEESDDAAWPGGQC